MFSMVSGLLVLMMLTAGQFAQSNTGELRVIVSDPSGLPLPGPVRLVSEANRWRETMDTRPDGVLVVKRLPFGVYRLFIERTGFSTHGALLEIRSAVPIEHRVAMTLASVDTAVTVIAADTLLDARQATNAQRLGSELLAQRTASLPGRSLPDLVNTQPGWLLEANGILHPRGSEYQTQYVVDGLPMTDNRSPAFAPEFGGDDVQGMTILTGGYPAEYGRKLGGVIEIVTAQQPRRGSSGSLSVAAGSFRTAASDAIAGYGWMNGSLGVAAAASATDRYLDPPVEENFTNHGTAATASARFEHDAGSSNRVGLIARSGATRFLVPNERVQEEAGQRQDRTARESAAQFSWQRIFTRRSVGDVRGMIRRVSADLWSNAAATPIAVEQGRGFREMYVKAAASMTAGAHELKAGADWSSGPVRERFTYEITDPGEFESGTPRSFTFHDRRVAREHALFVQDQIRLGHWTFNTGLRWDSYRLVITDRALSPRIAAAWAWPRAHLVVRASYDRAFQTPAFENLLLASSDAAASLSPNVVRLPVRPSRGHFYETGFSTLLRGAIRLDASAFVRRMSDVADDDLLLNTGVSFPIAFRRADIRGQEVKIEVSRWKNLTGFFAYSRLHGIGELPITGGLFLGSEGGDLLESTARFPITQDQRHTIRGRAAYVFSPRAWIAVAGSYGSGLPFEDFDDDPQEAVEEFGERIVRRVNFATGRVRPSASVDASGGFVVARSASRSLRLQVEVRNVTNRLDVINFAGLFSGTALAPPRSASVRLRLGFR